MKILKDISPGYYIRIGSSGMYLSIMYTFINALEARIAKPVQRVSYKVCDVVDKKTLQVVLKR